jgi:Na+/melibiose symporter-like transporter
MQFDLTSLMLLARETVVAPRKAARRIINLQLPLSVGWQAVALAAVASAVLSALSAMISGAGMDPELTALLQALVLLVTLGLVQGLGRAFGGKGALADALVLLAWLEVMLLLIQVVQLVLLVISADLAVVLGLVSFVIFLWSLASFVAELHGFASGGRVLGVILASFFVVSLLMALLGIGISVGGAGNV